MRCFSLSALVVLRFDWYQVFYLWYELQDGTKAYTIFIVARRTGSSAVLSLSINRPKWRCYKILELLRRTKGDELARRGIILRNNREKKCFVHTAWRVWLAQVASETQPFRRVVGCFFLCIFFFFLAHLSIISTRWQNLRLKASCAGIASEKRGFGAHLVLTLKR